MTDPWVKLNKATRKAAKNPTPRNIRAAKQARREYKEHQAKVSK
jgi:hypothetical protein